MIPVHPIALQNRGQEAFINALLAERIKQDAIWGGPEHDAGHTPDVWMMLIGERIVSFNKLPRPVQTEVDHATARRLLIEIAALACAGYEMDLPI